MINLLTVINIIKSLSDLISSNYPAYEIIDYDVSEDFKKPAFFIEVDDVQTSWVANDYIKESSKLNIIFFAEDRYSGFLDLLDMKNNLTMLFDEPLLVENEDTQYYVSLLETTSDLFKNDKVLTFSVTADLIQKVERKEATDSYMENLETNIQ